MTRSSQEAIQRVAVLSGFSIETTTEIFEALLVYATLQQLEGLPFTVPNIGEVSVTYRGDTMTSKGKSTQVDACIEPDAYLAKCIGQLHDGNVTDAELRMRELNARFLEAQLEASS